MEIRPPHSPDELLAASSLAEKLYRDRQYVQRLDSLGDHVVPIVAVSHDAVIGTFSIDHRLDGRTATEQHYGLDVSTFFPLLDSHQFMELGRLAVEAPDADAQQAALEGLIAGAQLWADGHGVKVAIVSLKPLLWLKLRRMGIKLTKLAGPEQLIRDEVPQIYWDYFFPAKAAEAPSAYAIELDVVREVNLEIAPAVKNGLVTFPYELTRPTVVPFPTAATAPVPDEVAASMASSSAA